MDARQIILALAVQLAEATVERDAAIAENERLAAELKAVTNDVDRG